jgi:hypothetical protein
VQRKLHRCVPKTSSGDDFGFDRENSLFLKRINVMTDIVQKGQEEILLDVSDEALEVAAGAAKVHASFTLGSCTGLSECPGSPA